MRIISQIQIGEMRFHFMTGKGTGETNLHSATNDGETPGQEEKGKER